MPRDRPCLPLFEPLRTRATGETRTLRAPRSRSAAEIQSQCQDTGRLDHPQDPSSTDTSAGSTSTDLNRRTRREATASPLEPTPLRCEVSRALPRCFPPVTSPTRSLPIGCAISVSELMPVPRARAEYARQTGRIRNAFWRVGAFDEVRRERSGRCATRQLPGGDIGPAGPAHPCDATCSRGPLQGGM